MNLANSFLLIASIILIACTTNNHQASDDRNDFLRLDNQVYTINSYTATPDVINGTDNWTMTFFADDEENSETIITGAVFYNPELDGAHFHVSLNSSGSLKHYVSICDPDAPDYEAYLINPNLRLSINDSFVDETFEVCYVNAQGHLEGPFEAVLSINH